MRFMLGPFLARLVGYKPADVRRVPVFGFVEAARPAPSSRRHAGEAQAFKEKLALRGTAKRAAQSLVAGGQARHAPQEFVQCCTDSGIAEAAMGRCQHT